LVLGKVTNIREDNMEEVEDVYIKKVLCRKNPDKEIGNVLSAKVIILLVELNVLNVKNLRNEFFVKSRLKGRGVGVG
jgi:hypothetical protein